MPGLAGRRLGLRRNSQVELSDAPVTSLDIAGEGPVTTNRRNKAATGGLAATYQKRLESHLQLYFPPGDIEEDRQQRLGWAVGGGRVESTSAPGWEFEAFEAWLHAGDEALGSGAGSSAHPTRPPSRSGSPTNALRALLPTSGDNGSGGDRGGGGDVADASKDDEEGLTAIPKNERVFWLRAPPGGGKTQWSVAVSARFPQHVCAHHFMQPSDPLPSSPERLLRLLVYALSERLPAYVCCVRRCRTCLHCCALYVIPSSAGFLLLLIQN